MFSAYIRRETVESAARTKDAMIGGLWANTSFDKSEDREARSKAISEIEENFALAVDRVYGRAQEPEETDLSAVPLFANMKVPELPSEFSEKDEAKIAELAKLSELSTTVDQSF